MSSEDEKTAATKIATLTYMAMGDEAVLAATFSQLCFLMMRQGILEGGIEAAQEMLKQDRMNPNDLGDDDATCH